MAIACVALMPMATMAALLDFPGNAVLAGEKINERGSYKVPVGAWQNGELPSVKAEGEVMQQAWKITATGLTTLQILDPLKKQLTDDGFKVVFECATDACGGFDFRFETDVIPEPVMHVDLGDFRFLSAERKTDDTPEYVTLLVSRSQNAGFVQLVRVGEPTDETALVTTTTSPALISISEPPPAEQPALPLEQALKEKGHYILEDLVFQTGSSDLGVGDFASLAALADYIKAHPDRTFALVGHTDAEGSLAGNIALSKKRAASVVRRLINDYGVDKKQISAEGNGFLSPRATNMTEDGRAQNRRVEVIDTSTR
ncbi:OmpA family protein [Profundibacter amoris]|uniref:OmpA family protein n=1 Tax=Profundibacter amoris TaxID=2171755 RepID=A0A347UM11_9RHOB|nr:OmpA family protein [Profundibacter amoris]AXX99889.1 OmpA family protein [Profundibacter amoris]